VLCGGFVLEQGEVFQLEKEGTARAHNLESLLLSRLLEDNSSVSSM